jgi:hypothetical protein
MTLYTYDKDEKGKTNCYDKCATNWPPLKAEAGAKADDEWSVVDRTDGSKMWAYDGKPVYTFIKDKKAGDVTGDGVAGVWHVVKADRVLEPDPASRRERLVAGIPLHRRQLPARHPSRYLLHTVRLSRRAVGSLQPGLAQAMFYTLNNLFRFQDLAGLSKRPLPLSRFLYHMLRLRL